MEDVLNMYVVDCFDDDEEKTIDLSPAATSTMPLKVSSTDIFLDVKNQILRYEKQDLLCAME